MLLGDLLPGDPEMQARAIFEAATAIAEETGEPVVPEVMIPLAGTAAEIEILKDIIERPRRRSPRKLAGRSTTSSAR